MTKTKTKRKAPAKALPITAETDTQARAVVLAQKPGSPAVDPGFLIAKAIDGKASMEVVERLFTLRKELKAEWAREQFFTALSAFQAECPAITRTKEVDGKYRYAPIEQVVKQIGGLWQKHGFAHTIKTIQPDAQNVTARVHVHHIDGHEEITEITMPLDTPKNSSGRDLMSKPQTVGSARSFARRYALCDAYGIVTEDDDTDAKRPVGTPPSTDPPKKTKPAETPPTQPRDVTPAAEPPKPAAPSLPRQLQGIKKVGEETYWMLSAALRAGHITQAYCETQGVRMMKNKRNEQFLAAMKIEVEAEIENGKGAAK